MRTGKSVQKLHTFARFFTVFQNILASDFIMFLFCLQIKITRYEYFAKFLCYTAYI